MRTRTVLHLASFGGPYPGNFIPSLVALADRCDQSGFRTVFGFSAVAGGRKWLSDLRSRYEVHVLAPGRVGDLIATTRLIAQVRPQIVHTHFTYYDISAAAGSRVQWRGPAPIVFWHVHSAFPVVPGWGRSAKDFVKFKVLGRDARVLTVSTELKRSIEERGGAAARVAAIPNGIDAERATLRTAPSQELRRRFGIPPDGRVVLVFGWEPITKGVDVVLDALQRLAPDRTSDALCVIVGAEKTRALVSTRGPGRIPVHVVPPQDCVGDLFSLADVFVSASRFEGFATAVAEALLNGVPVVASRIAGLSWAFDLPGIAWFESASPESLALELARALRSRAELSAGAADAARVIRERHGVDAWAARVVEQYLAALGGSAVSVRESVRNASSARTSPRG